MELISEILTQAGETKRVNVDQQKTFIILEGFPTLMSLLKSKGSVTSKNMPWNECLSLSTHIFWGNHFSRPWHGSPGSHSLLAMSWLSLCPHEHHEKHICHVPVEETQQNKIYNYPLYVFTLTEVNLDTETQRQGYPMLWILAPLHLHLPTSSWHCFSRLTITGFFF